MRWQNNFYKLSSPCCRVLLNFAIISFLSQPVNLYHVVTLLSLSLSLSPSLPIHQTFYQ